MSAATLPTQTAPAQIQMASVSPKRRPAFCTRRLTTSPSSSLSPLVPSQPVPLDVDYESDSDDSDTESICSTASSLSSGYEADDESPMRFAKYLPTRRTVPFIFPSSASFTSKSSIPFPSSFPDRCPPRGRHVLPKPLGTALEFQASQIEPRVAPSSLVGNESGISIGDYSSEDNLIAPSPVTCEPPTPSAARMPHASAPLPSRSNALRSRPRPVKLGQRDSALFRFLRAYMAHARFMTFL